MNFSSMDLGAESAHLQSNSHGKFRCLCAFKDIAEFFVCLFWFGWVFFPFVCLPSVQCEYRPKEKKLFLKLKVLRCPHDFIRTVYELWSHQCTWVDQMQGNLLLVFHKSRHSMAGKPTGSGASFESWLCHLFPSYTTLSNLFILSNSASLFIKW